MAKSKRKNKHPFRTWMKVLLAIVAIGGAAAWFFLFRSMTDQKHVVFVKDASTLEEVLSEVGEGARQPQFAAFKLLVGLTGYGEHMHEGRYDVGRKGALAVFRDLYRGQQTPQHVTVPSVRSLDGIAKAVCRKVRFTREEFMAVVSDSAFIDSLGYTPQTIIAAFTPNTYDVYWNISARNFVKRMAKESDLFWTDERRKKAEADSLTRMQVITLASIVQEETNIAKDKPIIAGLYINRLRIDMALQSCPTIRYALQDFTIRQVLLRHLTVESPYNTYKHKGLPPGPIRNPNPEDIDAVLDYDHNDYLYMCASAKFDGTHHFTKTYAEHKAYSVEYDKEFARRKSQAKKK